MSYQVLARKWRPRSFQSLVGQPHVVRALTNALEQGRLHHAYLFSGTRGVGKTTIARILAKALNCERGIRAEPCGRCSNCQEIDAGRFVDLIEVDAASRTKVEQTRALLDNVPFAPVKGRYKVYLIDEVHMFSASSFNALLKTLEEPPPHVCFILATTDPQRVPVTVLSRCLQFQLKRLLPEEIRAQLSRILEAENIPFELSSLDLLAQAADGSMRDALSLLDQAISYGAGKLVPEEVRALLGTVDRAHSVHILQALAEGSGEKLLAEVARIQELTPDFQGLVEDLLWMLHQIALYQQVPQAISQEKESVAALAQQLSPEEVQLYYQIALQGQEDLDLAPTPRLGLEMLLLRMLAFRPVSLEPAESLAVPSRASSPMAVSGKRETPTGQKAFEAMRRTLATKPKPAEEKQAVSEEKSPKPEEGEGTPMGSSRNLADLNAEQWHEFVTRWETNGFTKALAQHCVFDRREGTELHFFLDPAAESLLTDATKRRLEETLCRMLGSEVQLKIRVASTTEYSPAQRMAEQREQKQRVAEAILARDAGAQAMRETFDAHWLPNTAVLDEES